MPNALFARYKGLQLGDDASVGTLVIVNWETDTIRMALVDHGVDTPVPNTDGAYSDISNGVVGTPVNLASKTAVVAANILTMDAADTTLTSVTGASCESIVLAKSTGTPANDALIAFFDTATGLPVTPNGGDITVQWNASGIFTW